jgi:translation initiation factor 2 beta subunit (eIF-2beta)/eIF-5
VNRTKSQAKNNPKNRTASNASRKQVSHQANNRQNEDTTNRKSQSSIPNTREQQGNQSDDNNRSSSPNNSVELTLDNFVSQLENWLVRQLRKALQKNKNIQNNWIPPEIQDALALLQKNYIKSKLMLSLIGNVCEQMVNNSL